MNRMTKVVLLTATFALAGASAAFAWHLDGYVTCDPTGTPLSGVTILVESIDGGPAFSGTGTTDDAGFYTIPLPDSPREFRATVMLGANEDAVSPATGMVEMFTTVSDYELHQDWVISSPRCEPQGCWLTGGGAKISQVTGESVAECGRAHNFGGNVYPGCSSTAGDGGQWNHVAWNLKLHFQAFAIHVIRCGNVDGIPPGSDSPDTPYNFIEFEGSGRLLGIRGNKVDLEPVYFFARCEDRNEPGSQGQHDGAFKDRYFLHVFSDPTDPDGSTLLLVDLDGDPATVDPVTITDGNLQIHISSCDPVAAAVLSAPALDPITGPTTSVVPADDGAPTEVWFSRPGPNPASDRVALHFALPREAGVSLSVFDLGGRRVRDLVRGTLPAGRHSADWDLRDASGARVGPGMYFLRLGAGGEVRTRRLIVR